MLSRKGRTGGAPDSPAARARPGCLAQAPFPGSWCMPPHRATADGAVRAVGAAGRGCFTWNVPTTDRYHERVGERDDGWKALGPAFGLEEGQVERLSRFAHILERAGSRQGAVGPREGPRILERHIADSLRCLSELPGEAASAVDIGSGAGLPGLVLAIARPELGVTLVDARARRCRFLEEAADALGVSVGVICARAEELARSQHRDRYDVSLARALAPPPVALELCLPFVRVGGRCVLLVGDPPADVRAATEAASSALGGGVPRWVRSRPGSGADLGAGAGGGPGDLTVDTRAGCLLVVAKTAPSPQKFPRRTGIPRKRPLR